MSGEAVEMTRYRGLRPEYDDGGRRSSILSRRMLREQLMLENEFCRSIN